VLKQLDLQQIFNRELTVPNVNSYAELGQILQEVQAFDYQADIAESLNKLRDSTGLDVVEVGIKKVLLAIGEARQVGNVPGRFAEVMGLQMDSSRDYMSEWGR
jgi:vesicle-fusing ATPase